MQESKPAMVVIHKSWCGACKALEPSFAANAEITALAPQFVMIDVVDEEEPDSKEWSPDGGYIPRILFVHRDGSIATDVTSGHEKFKYFYHDASDIARNMLLFLSMQADLRKEL